MILGAASGIEKAMCVDVGFRSPWGGSLAGIYLYGPGTNGKLVLVVGHSATKEICVTPLALTSMHACMRDWKEHGNRKYYSAHLVGLLRMQLFGFQFLK